MVKTFFITIIFIINNQPIYLDGWHPFQVDNYEKCLKGTKKIEQDFMVEKESIPDYVQGIKVFCSVLLTPSIST